MRGIINSIIQWSIDNRPMVLLLTLILVGWGIYSARQIPLDAIPDLSDVQVIVKTPFPGQAPQIVEDQVTYPLASALLAVPGAITVRGYSFLGDSYIYVLFKDGTDPYWARTRVLEYLSQVADQLPAFHTGGAQAARCIPGGVLAAGSHGAVAVEPTRFRIHAPVG